MILKLDRTGCGGSKFELIDDIASLTLARDEEEKTEDEGGRGPIATAHIYFRDGRTRNANVTGNAYVLNDQGKTIDSFSRYPAITLDNPLGQPAGERRRNKLKLADLLATRANTAGSATSDIEVAQI